MEDYVALPKDRYGRTISVGDPVVRDNGTRTYVTSMELFPENPYDETEGDVEWHVHVDGSYEYVEPGSLAVMSADLVEDVLSKVWDEAVAWATTPSGHDGVTKQALVHVYAQQLWPGERL
jgi:hypothetical protein